MGHAFCDWREPLDSALVCATRKDGGNLLTVRHLLQHTGILGVRLLVLSACQIGNLQAGDKQNDFVNLPCALVAAGARSVLAPRWSVDDVAASMLVTNVLTRCVKDGKPLSDALAAARCWLRDDVTRTVIERWLDAEGTELPNAERLAASRTRYVETYAPDARPFADVVHWGAFELTGNPDPFGGGR